MSNSYELLYEGSVIGTATIAYKGDVVTAQATSNDGTARGEGEAWGVYETLAVCRAAQALGRALNLTLGGPKFVDWKLANDPITCFTR